MSSTFQFLPDPVTLCRLKDQDGNKMAEEDENEANGATVTLTGDAKKLTFLLAAVLPLSCLAHLEVAARRRRRNVYRRRWRPHVEAPRPSVSPISPCSACGGGGASHADAAAAEEGRWRVRSPGQVLGCENHARKFRIFGLDSPGQNQHENT